MRKLDNSLRVLFIDHTAEMGGGEIALLNLVRHLGADVDPIILLFSEGPLVEKLRPEIRTHVLLLPSAVKNTRKDSLGWSSLFRFKDIWFTVRQIIRVAAFVRSMAPNLIHTNSLKADIIGGLAGRLAGVPVIWHVRDRIEPDYLPKIAVHVFRFLSRTVPSYVVANSKATLATINLKGRREGSAIASGHVQAIANRVVHDGCEFEIVPRTLEAVQEAGRIGLIGRISPWKGQHVFLRAAAQVLNVRPDLRFEIIGSALFSEREYEKDLHVLCKDLGIQHAVRFVGFVDNVPERISQLNFVVHASITGEPFGQVIIEAMAEGKPVVATNGGGVPEIVKDGVTGLLVPMGDPARMAEAMEWLLANPIEAERMGRAGREHVAANFTIQASARMVESVYDQVLHAPEKMRRRKTQLAASQE